MRNKRKKNLELFELRTKLLQGDLIIIFNWWKAIIRIVGAGDGGCQLIIFLFTSGFQISRTKLRTQATRWELKDRMSFTTLNSHGLLCWRAHLGPETQLRCSATLLTLFPPLTTLFPLLGSTNLNSRPTQGRVGSTVQDTYLLMGPWMLPVYVHM